MAKCEFKIKNIKGFTKEQAMGQPVNFRYEDNEPILLGVITNVDDNYLYIDFEHDNINNDLTIEVNSDVCSMKLRGE